MSSIISSWQLWPGWLMSHDTSQSSPEPHRVHKHPSHHDRLEEDSVGSSDITLYRNICLLRTLPLCFLTEAFLQRICHGSEESPRHDPGHQHHDHHHGPQQLRRHPAGCQEWAPPSPWGVTFYSNEVTFGGGERRIYITKQISPSNQANIIM